MSIRSARARSVSRYSAMATRGNSLPGGGKNVVGGVRCEIVAVGMAEHLLVAAHLLVTGQVCPSGNLGFGWRGRRHDANRFVDRIWHEGTIAQQKGPGKTGAFDVATTGILQP